MAKRKLVDAKEDRRIGRTRNTLVGALIELLLERGWEAIGVADLCARADVSRSTFYLHYANKEELLESGFASLTLAIRAAPCGRPPCAGGRLVFVEGLSDHIFDNRRTFLAIIGANGSGIVREKFRQLLLKMISEDLAMIGSFDAATAHFLSGGFVALAAHLLAAKSSRAQDLADEFHRCSERLLAKT